MSSVRAAAAVAAACHLIDNVDDKNTHRSVSVCVRVRMPPMYDFMRWVKRRQAEEKRGMNEGASKHEHGGEREKGNSSTLVKVILECCLSKLMSACCMKEKIIATARARNAYLKTLTNKKEARQRTEREQIYFNDKRRL